MRELTIEDCRAFARDWIRRGVLAGEDASKRTLEAGCGPARNGTPGYWINTHGSDGRGFMLADGSRVKLKRGQIGVRLDLPGQVAAGVFSLADLQREILRGEQRTLWGGQE